MPDNFDPREFEDEYEVADSDDWALDEGFSSQLDPLDPNDFVVDDDIDLFDD
jgi:hypothetical protein